MKTVEKLTKAKRNMKAGNHRVEIVEYGTGAVRYYYYYNTIVATEYPAEGNFSIDDSYGTVSTTRVCNAYRKHFEYDGYTEIKENLQSVRG